MDDLSAEIAARLSEYTTEVEKDLEERFDDISKEAVKKLRKSGGFQDRSGSVKKGWARKKDGRSIVIYNKSPKTHLLNNGHLTRSGGRTRAFKFIEPVDEWVAAEAEKAAKEVVKR
jgi:hypothetical protein